MVNKPFYDFTAKWMGEERRVGERRVPIDGMTAVAALRRDVKHMALLGLSIIFLVGAPTFAAYVLRNQINFFFQQHGLKVRVFVPSDGKR